MAFSQAITEVQAIQWVMHKRFTCGCLNKKRFGNTSIWKVVKNTVRNVYVLTHEKREPWVQKGTTTFYFVNDGIQSALEKARQSAKGKDIRIQGGANTIQQFLNAGLVDEFFIHIAPLFLESGIRLFDGIDKGKYDLQIVEVVPSDLTTHLRYKLTKK